MVTRRWDPRAQSWALGPRLVTIYHFTIHHLQFTMYHLPFAIYHLLFAIYYLPFTIYHLLFIIYHPLLIKFGPEVANNSRVQVGLELWGPVNK